MNNVISRCLTISFIAFQCVLISSNLSCSKPVSGKISLNHPESVVYDASYHRYLISNVAGKNIISMDDSNRLTLFASGLKGPKGLAIRKDILYVSDIDAVRAFSLKDGKQLRLLNLPNSQFPNDIEVDDSHYLFCSDSNASLIYRIDLNTKKMEVFKNPQLIKPNGILYDATNKRLLICSQIDNSPIQALYWDTQKIETVMTTTFSSLDGFTRDQKGNYYITSWGSKGVFKLDPDFKKTPVLVKDGYNGPADIGYNPVKNILVLPVMMENRIDMIEIK